MNLAVRLASIALLIAVWFAGSHIAGPRLLPGPQAVGLAIVAEARSGALAFNLGVTLARVAAAFSIAMALGTVFGFVMGRVRLADRIGDPWLVLLLNLPALVIIVLAYIWAGLTETAALAAVVLNKLPLATVTVREGARALDRNLDEMAAVVRMGRVIRQERREAAAPRRLPATVAVSGRGFAIRPVAGLEDRADRRIAGPAEWRRLRDRRC